MKKLGFILKNTNGGESEAYSINKGDSWAQYASDARSAIKELKGFDESAKIVYLIKFLGNAGYLLGVIKSRPQGSGRPFDNSAAWVFVPSTAIVSGPETEKVLTGVVDAISGRTGTDKTALEKIFNEEYPEKKVKKPAIGRITSASDGGYALRFFNGDFTLPELLGENLAQVEYAKYKGVFLVHEKDGFKLQSGNELNFNPKPIFTIRPFGKIDNFEAYIEDSLFDSPIEVPAGSIVNVKWEKKGYRSIPKSAQILNNEDAQKLVISPNEYKKIIKRSDFEVRSDEGYTINFTIKISGKEMNGKEMDIPEGLYNNGVDLIIQAKDYEGYSKKGVRLDSQKPMKITLKRKIHHYEFTIPLQRGCCEHLETTISIDTKSTLSESPIEGYSLVYDTISERGNNELEPEFNKLIYKLKYIGIGIASCVVVILLYAGWKAFDKYEFNFGWPLFVEKSEEVVDSPDSGVQADDAQLGGEIESDAVKYLNNATIWHKDSLDAYVETKGMFDELNTFDKDALKDRFDNGLSGVAKLDEIVKALEDASANGRNVNAGKEKNDGKYNRPNDKGIDVENYINWIKSSPHSFVVDNPQPSTTTTPVKQSKIQSQPKDNQISKKSSTQTSSQEKKRRGGESD